VKENTDT